MEAQAATSPLPHGTLASEVTVSQSLSPQAPPHTCCFPHLFDDSCPHGRAVLSSRGSVTCGHF